MGKHDSGYKRVERDFYPTKSRWVVPALAEHVDLYKKDAWEFSCGRGDMVSDLRLAGCARVYASDIVDYGCGQDEVFDFLSDREPNLAHYDILVTNPPYGYKGKLMSPFIRAGLRRLRPGGLLCLLLPVDCDSAKTRRPYFDDCSHFAAKITLTQRIKWFERNDGERKKSPKENHAWFVWSHGAWLIRQPAHRPASVLYGPQSAQRHLKLV